MSVIKFDNVSEKYRIKFVKDNKVSWEEVWALSDVDFAVEEGDIFGVIGQNGAGKTTLLKLIAGMIIPDKGRIDVNGKVASLMELGAGFNAEFTGKENIVVNARIYGLKEDAFSCVVEQIIAFADLGKFIDAPIKYYSQGMYMRLAFALAIFIDPDILLIDDVLAVGDDQAQQKCIKKVMELKESGKTVVLVSHDMGMVLKLCNRAMLLEKGKIVFMDKPARVVSRYLETSGDKKGIGVLEKDGIRAIFNNGRIRISYDGSALTKGLAGYMAFLPPSNTWNFSTNLYWQVDKIRERRIAATGKSSDGSVMQNWEFALEDGCLFVQADIKGDVKDPHIDCMFSADYNQWATTAGRGLFPAFTHKTNWQDIGLAGCPGGILGICPDTQKQELPGLVFSMEDAKEEKMKLFNTGFDLECSVVQLPLDNENSISFCIKLCPEKNDFEGYLSGRRLWPQQSAYTQQEKHLGNVA